MKNNKTETVKVCKLKKENENVKKIIFRKKKREEKNSNGNQY
jgi:hypothetical protein